MSGLHYILLLLLVCNTSGLFSQSINEIKKKQERVEKEIRYLNKLLNQTRSNKSTTMQQLSIVNQKIIKGKEVLQTLGKEVKYYEELITKNEIFKSKLESDRSKMLDFYAKMIYETWKNRKETNKLMYIFSSSSMSEAYARYKYFEQVQDYSKRQIQLIERTNDSLTSVNKRLNILIAQRNSVQVQIAARNAELVKEQNVANKYILELKQKEKDLSKKLKTEIKNRERFAKELKKLIDVQVKKSGSENSNYKLTSEEKLVSDDFAKNKGKLPWPVTEGFVSEKFGVSVHPVFKLVKMVNDGITITTTPNAEVRAVFNGVVTEIMFMPGYNNIVIVRHGNYLTLYSNLIDVYVKKGESIKLKGIIGKLAKDGDNSTLNFQIWKDRHNLDPEMWLSPL